MIGNFVDRRPATAAQHRIWLVDQQGPRGLEFSFPYLFELRGACEPERLADVITQVVTRHAPLRTTFAVVGDVLEQHTHPPTAACFEYLDLTGDDAADEVGQLIADEVATPFDLGTDWPLRVRLYRVGPAQYRLLFTVHHIATDGLSMQIMLDEISVGYRGEELPDIRVGPGSGQLEPAEPAEPAEPSADVLAFWKRALSDPPGPVTFPGQRRPRRQNSFSGRWFDLELSVEDTAGLDQLARDSAASTYSALFGLLTVAIGRRTGGTELVLGVPFSGRRPDEERLIGFFVNLLPVRFRYDERMTPRQLCAAAADAVTEVLEHAQVPLDRIIEHVPQPDGGIGSLLNVTLTEEQTPRLTLAGTDATYRDLRMDVARYQLAVDYRRLASGALRFEVSYAKDQLSRRQVAALLADVAALTRAAAREPDRPLATLSWPTGPLSVLADPQAEPRPDSLAAVWQQTVARQGNTAAVVDGDGELTFADLDHDSAALAERLAELGVAGGQRVALLCERSRDFFVALLAVLRRGATPVLLDAGHPAPHLANLVSRSGATLTLCSHEPGTDIGRASVVPASVVPASPRPSAATRDWPDRGAGTLAYAVFTSGSTGSAKCVGIEDGNLLRLLANLTTLGLAEPTQRIALNASLGFDASVQQWVRIFAGCTVVILDDQTRRDPAELPRYLIAHDVAEMDISPRHLDALFEPLLDELRRAGRSLRLLIGGEALPAPLWSRIRDAVAGGLLVCWNMYGPTENTVDSTTFPLAMSDEPTIGLPLPGIRAYVLDAWLRPVPLGTPGLLFLAGDGVGRGYLDAPGATARAFLADPIAGDGSRMYATGDRVRLTSDYRLEFLGRADEQVKINGYRVEPREVEATVLTHPGVSDCAVLADTSGPQPTLRLFAVCTQPTLDALPGWLASRLPSFMVPHELHRVPKIPLGPQGKVDRRATQEQAARPRAAPEPAPHPAPQSLPPAVEPAMSSTAEVIAEVWRDVLRKAVITSDDDFFTLGGHSLLAIRVVARIRREMGVTLPISSVFAFPVLRDLADHIEQLRTHAEQKGRT